MLPRQHRLKSSQAFHLVYKQGTSFTAKHLRLVALKHPQCGDDDSLAVMPALTTRIGLSVSKKVSKHAVVRNRIRRQLRSSFRQLLPFLSPGWLLVVVARNQAQECNYAQFLRELEQLLRKAEVIHGDQGGDVL